MLEPLDLLWLEIDMYDPKALYQIKESTTTRICSGENLFYMRDFIPYFELHAADVMMIDVPWNGFSQSKKIGDLAEVYQMNIAPHNYYSHLATHISASLCAVCSCAVCFRAVCLCAGCMQRAVIRAHSSVSCSAPWFSARS